MLKSPCVQVLGDALLAAGEKKAAKKAWKASLSRYSIKNTCFDTLKVDNFSSF